MRKDAFVSVLLPLLFTFAWCQEATILAQAPATPQAPVHPTEKPVMVCVTDFLLDAQSIQQDSGLLGGHRSGPLGRRQGSEDPQSQAAKLTESLSEALVTELDKKGIPACRMAPGAELPSLGWRIEGEFLEVDEGNRLKRAAIGFGSGAAEMQVEVRVSELGRPGAEPILVMTPRASDASKGPGAAVTMNPYAAAAKLVLSKDAAGKEVHKLASAIAAGILKYMHENGLIGE